jgi:chaperone modulatory protein CbpM
MTDELWFYLSLDEVTESFGVTREVIVNIIDEGIVVVEGEESQWQFDGEAVRYIRTVLQLERDLGVNLAGAALALELLEEIEKLKSL